MTIQEKINFAAQPNIVFLFKEGLFYKLYNQNAMWFINHIKPYKVTVKFVKKVNQNVFTIGFPQSVLKTNALQLNLKLKQDTKNYLCYQTDYSLSEQQYAKWCNTALATHTGLQSKATTQSIIHQLNQFDVANTTPLQALEFIVTLKAML